MGDEKITNLELLKGVGNLEFFCYAYLWCIHEQVLDEKEPSFP